MKPYIILENGDELIIASWEEKMRKLNELSKQVNKIALQQNELIQDLERVVSQKICEVVAGKYKPSIGSQAGSVDENL